MSDLRVGNIGSILRMTIVDENDDAVDVSTASTKTIYLRSPSGRVKAKAASFTTDGTNGQIQYATIADDLDVPGEFLAQAKVVIGSNVYWAKPIAFKVGANIAP